MSKSLFVIVLVVVFIVLLLVVAFFGQSRTIPISKPCATYADAARTAQAKVDNPATSQEEEFQTLVKLHSLEADCLASK